MTFPDLPPALGTALAARGYEALTPVQAAVTAEGRANVLYDRSAYKEAADAYQSAQALYKEAGTRTPGPVPPSF